jgi:hypothetical protein
MFTSMVSFQTLKELMSPLTDWDRVRMFRRIKMFWEPKIELQSFCRMNPMYFSSSIRKFRFELDTSDSHL